MEKIHTGMGRIANPTQKNTHNLFPTQHYFCSLCIDPVGLKYFRRTVNILWGENVLTL